MKIKRMSLRNFAGIKALDFDFNEKSALISGENATGKTTVFDAYIWLLTGQNSTNEKSWTPKTKDADGQDVHGLEHSAEMEISIEGKTITLKKSYHETYTKSRGKATAEFTGHTTDYEIDGVPHKQKDYNEKVAWILGVKDPAEIMPLVILDNFAQAMTWQDRRRTLMEIVGDISDQQVIDAKAELKPLEAILKPTESSDPLTIEEVETKTKASNRKINDRLKSIPARIDEAAQAKPEVEAGITEELINTKLAELKVEQEEVTKLYDLAKEDRGSEIKRAKIQKVRAKQDELEEVARETYKKEQAAYDKKAGAMLEEMREAYFEIAKLKEDQDLIKRAIREKEELRDELAERFKRTKERNWENAELLDFTRSQKAVIETHCPTCEQELPANKIQEARDKFEMARATRIQELETQRENFNKDKAEALRKINAEGQECSSSNILDLHVQIDKLQISIEKLEEKREQLQQDISKLPKPAENMLATLIESEEYKELERQRKQIEEEGENAAAIKNREGLQNKLSRLKAYQMTLEENKTKLEIIKQQNARIEELSRQEEELAAAYEENEHTLNLLDIFTRTKADLLSDSINSKFKNVKFQLFSEQVNGGLQQTCEVLVPSESGSDVPYGRANTGGRMQAGFEIVKVLQEHHGKQLPVFIDNFESLSKDLEAPEEMQIIKLQVVKSQKKIKITSEE